MSFRPKFLFIFRKAKPALLLPLLSAFGPIVAVSLIHSLYYFMLLPYSDKFWRRENLPEIAKLNPRQII